MKEDEVNFLTDLFNSYINKFSGLTEEQHKNFTIKKEHSLRVAGLSDWLSQKLKLGETDRKIAFITGLFHDIGRFPQLLRYNTFNDAESVDHGEYSVEIIQQEEILSKSKCEHEELIYSAVRWHNKYEFPKNLSDKEQLHIQLLRDADKLDILKVLTDYYSQRNAVPNHTLTWELPRGVKVSDAVVKDVMAGRQVRKKDVISELDIKIMQLSWIFDLNFKSSVGYVLEKRFLEKIYDSLPKNDRIIDIFRKIKVFAENKMLQ